MGAEKAEECFAPLYNFQHLAFMKSVDEINGLMSADGQNTLKCRYILEILFLDLYFISLAKHYRDQSSQGAFWIVKDAKFLHAVRKTLTAWMLKMFQVFIVCTCQNIMKTCLYNFDPLKPHFYIVKLGFTGYTLFFLFLLKNIDCGYALELPL